MSGACGPHLTAVPCCQDSSQCGDPARCICHLNSMQFLRCEMVRMFYIILICFLSQDLSASVSDVHIITKVLQNVCNLHPYYYHFLLTAFLKKYLMHAWPVFGVKEIESELFILFCLLDTLFWSFSCCVFGLLLHKVFEGKEAWRVPEGQSFFFFLDLSLSQPYIFTLFQEEFKVHLTEMSKTTYNRQSLWICCYTQTSDCLKRS